MKNSADFGGCNPPRPSVSVDNTLHYLEKSSYPTRPHSIIANSVLGFKTVKWSSKVRVSLKLTCLYSPLLQAYYHPQLYTFSLECFQGKSYSKQRSLSSILSAIRKSVIRIISFNLITVQNFSPKPYTETDHFLAESIFQAGSCGNPFRVGGSQRPFVQNKVSLNKDNLEQRSILL